MFEQEKHYYCLIYSMFSVVRCVGASTVYIAFSFLSLWEDLATTSKVTRKAYENHMVHTYCFAMGFL